MRLNAALQSRWTVMLGVLVLCAGARPATAQLTEADLAALRAQGAEVGWTFEMALSPATEIPLEQLCGLKPPLELPPDARFVESAPRGRLPDAFDWRDYGTLPPIRDQASCGSCWAFATLGPLECNIALKDYAIVDLSEQWMVSCNSDGWGCGGGWWAHDYLEWKTDPCGGFGAPFEADFPYTATDAPCNCPYPHQYTIDGWAYIGSQYGVPPVDNIKQALMDYGPLSVAVYVNSAFHAYSSGVFNGCQSSQPNHGVTLIGWDDSLGSNGAWIIRNSWGPSWGEAGHINMPYNCSQIGYAAAYINYAGTLPAIQFSYPNGMPLPASPDGTTFTVEVAPGADTPVPGTAMLHYALDGSLFESQALVHLGGDLYEGTLPAADCFSRFAWYITVDGANSGEVTEPAGAPAETHLATVATTAALLLQDDFEDDNHWMVYQGAASGNWERSAPQESEHLGDIAQPGADHSATGTRCFVTGATAGQFANSNDVDGGPARLMSPIFDVAGSDGIVTYWRWFFVGGTLDDQFVVEVTNDNATWVPVETLSASAGWTQVEWRVSDYVTPTNRVRVRFVVSDTPNNSVVEALVDDFRIERVSCAPYYLYDRGDMNCDGVVNFDDINGFVSALLDPDLYGSLYADCDRRLADINEDDTVDFNDINGFVVLVAD